MGACPLPCLHSPGMPVNPTPPHPARPPASSPAPRAGAVMAIAGRKPCPGVPRSMTSWSRCARSDGALWLYYILRIDALVEHFTLIFHEEIPGLATGGSWLCFIVPRVRLVGGGGEPPPLPPPPGAIPTTVHRPGSPESVVSWSFHVQHCLTREAGDPNQNP